MSKPWPSPFGQSPSVGVTFLLLLLFISVDDVQNLFYGPPKQRPAAVYDVRPRTTTSTVKPFGLYQAPSHYPSKGRPALQSFIITSKPLTFTGKDTNGQNVKLATLKVTQRPWGSGVATILCKGKTCGSSPTSGNARPTHDDYGFPGEAIPIETGDDHDDFATVLLDSGVSSWTRPILLGITPTTSKPSSSSSGTSSTSVVHLLTERPYLKRGTSAWKKTTPKTQPSRRPVPVRRSTSSPGTTTTTITTTTTTRSTTVRPLANQGPFLTTASSSSAQQATTAAQSGLRPQSVLLPAVTAFTLMALPVAAAAVPLLIQAGRRRRRKRGLPGVGLDISDYFGQHSRPMGDDLRDILPHLEEFADFSELEKDLGALGSGTARRQVAKARERLRKASSTLAKLKHATRT